jgi:hypothetical protein
VLTAEIAGGDEPIDRFEAELVQRVGRVLDQVDLAGRKGIASRFPPLRLATGGMEVETQRLDLLAPIRTRR